MNDVQRVPRVPFAQIANAVLRDKRLSFRARGILAMVLSYPGDWSATREWLEGMSDRDGREAIQSALRELTDLGYRSIRKERVDNLWITVVVWSGEPPTDGFPVRRESRPSGEPSVFLKTVTNTKDFDGRESRLPAFQRFDGWPEREAGEEPLPPDQQAERARQLREQLRGEADGPDSGFDGRSDSGGGSTTSGHVQPLTTPS